MSTLKVWILVVVAVVMVACAHGKTVRHHPETVPAEATSSTTGYSATGMASWYGPGFHGRRTASGKRFNSKKLTAAHRTLPFGTRVLVTNLANDKSVEVVINDRGPALKSRVIDLSFAAAKKIGCVGTGVARVSIEVVSDS